MDIFKISEDIPVCYIKAGSFPDGVQESHQELHKVVPFSKDRKYYGISWPGKDGNIMYKAAAEELIAGEGKRLGLETMIIKKGNYKSMLIKDFTNDISAIGNAFDDLLKDPAIDHKGFCLEWYLNTSDVQCMVRLEGE